MRTIAYIILCVMCCCFSYASDSSIKKVKQGELTAYVVEAGAFPHENNALQLKLKLSSIFKKPVSITHSNADKLYTVIIGPVLNLKDAEEIERQLSEGTTFDTQANTPTEETSEAPTVDSSKKTWNLRNADIRAVIAEVSRVTGKNFIIDPRVQGKISIVSTTPMSDKELYQVFLSMLQVSGYAAIPSGNVIKIIPNIDAKTTTGNIIPNANFAHGDEMLVEVIPVHYVPAEQLVPVLRPLMPQWSNVSAYSPSNMLILSGRANNIKQLADIIKQVDSSKANGIDMVPLNHALAMDVATTLKDLVKSQSNIPGRAPTMIAADDRSNAILVSGNRTERIRLRLLIAKLDKENSNGNNSNTQVIYLNYLRAEDLAPILAGIAQANFSGNVATTIGTITQPVLDSTNPASNLANYNSGSGNSTNLNQGAPIPTANPAAAPNTTGATTQNEGTTKPTVQIIAEPNTNSIIINGPSALIRILKTVINQLDIKPAQILIEALVAEVDQKDVNSLGIEWGSNLQTGKPGSFRPGFAIINSKTSMSDFQAQLYALSEQRKANILSTPSVMVLDNRQAKILVGKQVSVASTSYPNNANGTTTSSSPYTTFERVNVALHLYVRPQITRDQGIQLQIDQGNDTIDPSSALDSTNPTFKISSIVTSVHVESGDILVLGGLTQDSLADSGNRLPILGDLPGLGKLFQKNVRDREKQVLMVFIRPVILRTEKDNYQVSGGKYYDLRQSQLEFLRQEEYHTDNEVTALPPLKSATLPKPFATPVEPMAIVEK